jgi:hypothetical protein
MQPTQRKFVMETAIMMKLIAHAVMETAIMMTLIAHAVMETAIMMKLTAHAVMETAMVMKLVTISRHRAEQAGGDAGQWRLPAGTPQ